MAEIADYFGVAGISLVLLAVFVEITPIKINPIRWLGDHLNKTSIELSKRTEKKLDEHIAQSYRDKILSFQNSLRFGLKFTYEEWNEVIDACDAYEKYVEENKLKNGKADLAIKYIKGKYTETLNTNEFAQL